MKHSIQQTLTTAIFPKIFNKNPRSKLSSKLDPSGGADYLYPRGYFEPVHLTELAEQTILAYLDSSRKENLELQEV